MPILTNPKYELFCQSRITGHTIEKSYTIAGFKGGRQAAARLAKKPVITARIRELQQGSAAAYECTVDSMARQYDEDRALAIKHKQIGAAVNASVAKAKLFGLTVDRSAISVTHNYAMMTEEELRFELAAIAAEARSLKPGVQH